MKNEELLKIKDDFINFYINENHTRVQTCEHFNMSEGDVSKACKLFSIQKLSNRIPLKKFDELILIYTRDDFLNIYNTNSSIGKIEKLLHADYYTVIDLINYYGIKKRTIAESVKLNCELTYGVDNIQQIPGVREKISFAHKSKSDEEKEIILEKHKATLLARYGDANYCNKEKYKQTCIEKYGTDSYMKSDDFKHKSKEFMLLNYDVEHYSKSDEFKNKSKQTCLERFGVEHPAQSEAIKEKMKQTCFERYGVEYAGQIANKQEKSKETCLKKYGETSYTKTEEFKQKFKATCNKRFGYDCPAQSPLVRRRVSLNKHKYIASNGECLDSSWELSVYEYCLRNNISIERNIPIKYEYNGKSHFTVIDFKIDDILFEVKGTHLLNGCYDKFKYTIPINVKLDTYRKNHVVLITQKSDIFGKPNSNISNGLKYLDKCPDPLIGVDIELFQAPNFPYAPDRPKCFYDVKVNHDKSAFEAFMDESIRWKMIKNRIMYSGGFIDNKQILTALNVTRTCKQPSWFSKNFAKYIIENYITTDTIIDPFAGWGMRYDAAMELNKKYIGCDLNKELVDWHQEHGRDIKYDDANVFKYNGYNCSVFICPPYQDIETYFNGQDLQTTQCEWLQVVMDNIPNAKEYIMVCKVVDPGWEKYIVETKTNKSHFGKNNEYIIKVIKNEFYI